MLAAGAHGDAALADLAAERVAMGAVVFLLSYSTAFMETLTIAHVSPPPVPPPLPALLRSAPKKKNLPLGFPGG